MQEIIITGASRGFGRFLAIHLAQPDRRLHLVSRSDSAETARDAKKKGSDIKTWQIDLSQTDKLEEAFHPVLDSLDTIETDFLGLINNAGTIEPVGPLGKYAAPDYRAHLELNYVAPAILTHLFIKRFQTLPASKRVIFVGSGASRKPIHGWSHYCSSKAGIDMLAKTAALEQEKQKHPVEIAVFNPGRIETDMQEVIRSKSEEDFPRVDDFIASETDGRNLPPQQMAEELARIFTGKKFPHGEITGR